LAGKASRYRRGVCVANEGKVRMRAAAEIVSRYYVRLMVLDKAGSLGTMTTVLGRHGVSILAATQKATPEGMENPGYVPVVILTHAAKGAEVDAALREIRAAGVLSEEPVKLRMI
jgi:homoserine dehydrogenase